VADRIGSVRTRPPSAADLWVYRTFTIRVQDVYVWHELRRQSPDEIVTNFPQLTLADVHAALAYYWDNTQEIQQEMAQADAILEQLKQASPSPLQEKLRGTDASGAQVSS
jgi:uncharacterized protein (DUF433 family)